MGLYEMRSVKLKTKTKFLPLMVAVPTLLSMAVHAATDSPADAHVNGFEMSNVFNVTTVARDDDGSDQQYTTQVLESRGVYTFKDRYSVNYWVKIAEGVWGQDFGVTNMSGANEFIEVNIETLYGQYRGDAVTLSAGMLPIVVGNAYTIQVDGLTGTSGEWQVNDKFSLMAFGGIVSENDSTDDTGLEWEDSRGTVDGDGGNGDEYMLGVQLNTSFQQGDIAVYYATDYSDEYTDSDDITYDEWNLQALGVAGHYNKGKVSFEGEMMTFFGEASEDTDYTGLQGYLTASYPMDKSSVQGSLYFALGADDDETQATSINKFGMVQPMQQGLGQTFDHSDTDLKVLAPPLSVFDPFGNAGVIGAAVNGSYSVAKPVTLSAGLLFLTPEGDSDYDSLSIVNTGIHYEVNDMVKLGAAASYKAYAGDDDRELLSAGAAVNFYF